MFSNSSQMVSDDTYTVYYGFTKSNQHSETFLTKRFAEWSLKKGEISRWESREVSKAEYQKLTDQILKNLQIH